VHGLWLNAVTSGRLHEAQLFADQLLEFARDSSRPFIIVIAHYAQGFTRYSQGFLDEGRLHFRTAIEHYREEDFRDIPDDA
jgi:hypothetical protein